MAQAQQKDQSNNQPLFFQNPVPLQIDKHAKSGLSKEINYKFAKDTNSAPVNIQEFGLIAKHYPIVFTPDEVSSPVAVLGLENSKNLYVNNKGEWEKDTYIPAYARRYPFAFTGTNDSQLVLCIDEASDRYKASANKDDDKFFSNKEQTEFTKSALQYCADYHRDQKITLQFTQALKDKGLLVTRQITATVPGRKEPVVLGGFSVIDEEKLAQLDEQTIVKWFRNGFLALINFHFLSSSNWQNLVSRLSKK